MAQRLPQAVTDLLARREQRMHHYVWHLVRNLWLFFDAATRHQLRSLDWEPPRPARRPHPGANPTPIYDNDSGEDFLSMHRQMIAAVNAQLAAVGAPSSPRVEGWQQLPALEDDPVPPAWDTGDAGLNDYLREPNPTNIS